MPPTRSHTLGDPCTRTALALSLPSFSPPSAPLWCPSTVGCHRQRRTRRRPPRSPGPLDPSPAPEEALATATATFAGEVAHPRRDAGPSRPDARLPEYSGRDKMWPSSCRAAQRSGTQARRRRSATGRGSAGAEAATRRCADTKPTSTSASIGPTQSTRASDRRQNTDGVPDRVEVTLDEMTKVWRTNWVPTATAAAVQTNADPSTPVGAFDVYLSETSQQRPLRLLRGRRHPHLPELQFWTAWLLRARQRLRSQLVPPNSPIENLQFTAAHQFFHAIQFGYDAYEDAWFMEGTAAWIEDEVYDG